MQHEIPREKEEISTSWLQNVLTDYENTPVKVKDFSIEAGAERGDNFASQVFRLRLTYDKDGEPCAMALFLKLTPCIEWHRKFVKELKIFHREAIAYTEIFPAFTKLQTLENKVELSIPKIIHAKISEDAGVIVLEDLRAKGYKMVEIRHGQDVHHCKLMMKELAKLHALGYKCKYSRNSILEKIPSRGHHNEIFRAKYKKHIDNVVSLLQALPDKQVQAQRLQQQTGKILDALFETYIPVEPYATICHGCTWNNNMLFRYDDVGTPVDIRLIDFQTIHYTCPTIDLSYFFCTSTAGQLRQEHFLELLQLYHDTLFHFLDKLRVTELTIDDFPFQVLLSRYYRHSGCFGMVQGFSKLSVVLAQREDIFDSKSQDVKDVGEALDKLIEMAKEGTKKTPNAMKRLCDLLDEMSENKVF